MSRPLRLVMQDNAILDPARQAGVAAAMHRAGAGRVQQDVVWGDVFKNGAYDWSKIDSAVNAARGQGMKVGFRLFGTPRYMKQSRPDADYSLSADHPNAALAGKFAEAVAQHFRGRVDRFGVWNEPNVGSFLNRDGALAARDYRSLYGAMYRGIKGVDPHMKVGLGEITSQQPNTPGVYSTIGFLKQVLAGKKPLHADFVGVHPYQWSDPRKKVGNAYYGGVSNIQAVADELKKAKLGNKLLTMGGHTVPLSATEFGYKHDAQGDPAVRARWMRESLRQMASAGVQDVNLYQLVPSKAGDYWDSSIADAGGRVNPLMARVLQDARRGRL